MRKVIMLLGLITIILSLTGCAIGDRHMMKVNYKTAIDGVKRDLKDPSSGEFNKYDPSYLRQVDKNTIVARLKYSANNSYGARMKDEAMVELKMNSSGVYSVERVAYQNDDDQEMFNQIQDEWLRGE